MAVDRAEGFHPAQSASVEEVFRVVTFRLTVGDCTLRTRQTSLEQGSFLQEQLVLNRRNGSAENAKLIGKQRSWDAVQKNINALARQLDKPQAAKKKLISEFESAKVAMEKAMDALQKKIDAVSGTTPEPKRFVLNRDVAVPIDWSKEQSYLLQSIPQ